MRFARGSRTLSFRSTDGYDPFYRDPKSWYLSVVEIYINPRQHQKNHLLLTKKKER